MLLLRFAHYNVTLSFAEIKVSNFVVWETETKVWDLLNMQDVLNHVSDRSCHLTDKRRKKLEGKYSLESTDPRESEIRAHLRP